jgi:hypothetical protein
MTINLADNTPRIEYTVAEGVTESTAKSIPFIFFDGETDIKVYVDNVARTYDDTTANTTQFTVTGGNGSTGSFTTTVTGATGGSTIVVTREIALERTSDFQPTEVFNANPITTLNTQLDRLTAIQADFNDEVTRAIALTDSDTAASMVLPTKANRLGKILGFNASTGAVEMFSTLSLSIAGESGTASIDTASGQTLTVAGGEGIDTTASNQTITISGEDASTTNKGIANYSSTYFSVTGGTVSLNPDQTGITSLLATDIKIGEDDETKIDFETADQINFYANNVNVVQLSNTNSGDAVFTVPTSDKDFVIKGNDGGSTITALTIDMSNSGDASFNNNVTVGGNLTVNGSSTTVNTATLTVEDPLISLASGNNSSDSVDVGFYGLYDTTGSQDLYAGLFRDASDSGKFKLFKDLQVEPTITVNTGGTGYAVGTLVANLEGNVNGTLDNLDSTQFLRSDTDDTLTATLTTVTQYQGGSTALPSIILKGGGPNIIRFIDGDNTSNLTNGVDLAYRTGPNDLLIEKSNGGNKIAEFGGDDGHASLYFDNSLKLETTSGGIEVTGTVTDDGATHDGDVTFTGTSGNIVFDKSSDILKLDDSVNVMFGTGNDLRIFHASGASIIRDQNSNPIYLQTNGTFFVTKNNNAETMAKFIGDGAVELYYNNVKKFETTGDGIAVTGPNLGTTSGDTETVASFFVNNGNGSSLRINKIRDGNGSNWNTSATRIQQIIDVTQQGYIQFNGNDNLYGLELGTTGNEKFFRGIYNGAVELYHNNVKKLETTSDGAAITGDLTLTSTDSGSGDDPSLILKRDSSSPSGNDNIGNIDFVGENDASQEVTYASISGMITTTTDGSERGRLRFSTMKSGVMTDHTDLNHEALEFRNEQFIRWVAQNGSFYIDLNGGTPTANRAITLPDATGTLLTTGNSDTPTTTTSSSDADFVLVDDGGTMKKITPANLGIGGGGGGTTSETWGASLNGKLNLYATNNNFIIGNNNDVTQATEPAPNLTGSRNHIIGDSAGNSLTSGNDNVAIGRESLMTHTSGSYNTALGNFALRNSTTSNDNTAIGYEALRNVTSGSYHTAIGFQAGDAITSASYNTIVGTYSGTNMTTGDSNTTLGTSAGYHISTASSNVAIGRLTQYGNTGSYNTSLGYEAYRGSSSTSYNGGSYNVAIGYRTYRRTSGHSVDNYNTCVGTFSGSGIYSGDYNTFLGYNANPYYNNSSYAVAIGYNAKSNHQGSTTVGSTAGASMYLQSDYTTLIGYGAGYDLDGGDHCTFVGVNSGYAGGSGNNNVGLGNYSVDALSSGYNNTGVGYGALSNVTSGWGNTGMGYFAGEDFTTGNGNTFIGYQAGGDTSSNYTGSSNTIIGFQATASSTSAINEITLGDAFIGSLRCNQQTISSLSDRRDKTAIEDLDLGLDFIKAMRPVKFAWNRRDGGWHGRKEIGFIAQELHEVEMDFNSTDRTRLVSYENPSKLEARPMSTYPILVKAIQELSAKVDSLQARITELEGA